MATSWQLSAPCQAFRTSRRPAAARLPSRRVHVVAQARPAARSAAPEAATEATSRPQVLAVTQAVLAAAAANVMTALPAHAVAGKIFDFNATLPIMVTEFLLLMVFLEKFWFTPVGDNLDQRDKYIRDKLASVKGDSTELESLQKEAESVTSKARGEAGQLIGAARTEAQKKAQEEIGQVKSKLDKELEQALSALDKERDSAVSNLDAQVDRLAGDILGRVLPEGVKL